MKRWQMYSDRQSLVERLAVLFIALLGIACLFLLRVEVRQLSAYLWREYLGSLKTR